MDLAEARTQDNTGRRARALAQAFRRGIATCRRRSNDDGLKAHDPTIRFGGSAHRGGGAFERRIRGRLPDGHSFGRWIPRRDPRIIEYSHRLLATVAGILSPARPGRCVRTERVQADRVASIAALVLMIVKAALGALVAGELEATLVTLHFATR